MTKAPTLPLFRTPMVLPKPGYEPQHQDPAFVLHGTGCR